MRADVAFARSLAAALLLICAVLCTFVSAAPSYDIGDARLTVSSFDGAARLTREFKSSAAVPATPETLAVEPDDVLKLTFAITTSASSAKVTGAELPHQAWIVLADEAYEKRPFVWPLRVRRSTASASWSLRADRLPGSLRNELARADGDTTYRLKLLLASFPSADSQLAPLELPLLELHFAEALRKRFTRGPDGARHAAEAAEGFLPWPANQHTFAKAPWLSMPPAALSAAIALAVIACPWLFLATAWSRIASVPSKKPTSAALALCACVAAFEGLAAAHWVGSPVWLTFPTVGAVAVITLLTCRYALLPAGSV